MVTENWTVENYKKYIVNNNLHNLWYNWCNPTSIDGIRVSAYTPIYSPEVVAREEKQCTKKSCINGTYRIPEESKTNKIIYKKTCDVCNASKSILYRWISQYDRTKIYFADPNEIFKYRGRSFYATLTLYDKKLVNPSSQYVDESLIKAHTLGMDIDIESGTICDPKNKENLQKCLNIIREELNTFVPNSYNLQTSGNGVYVFLHHSLCTKSVRYTMSQYNSYIKYLQTLIEFKGVKGIRIDPINMLSRVYKLIGSIHQKYDLSAIPLEYDCNIEKIENSEFKTENFNINKYIEDKKLNFYNRVNINESINLYNRLEEHSTELESSNLRAYKHIFDETGKIAVEAITGESQNINPEKLNISKEDFMQKYVGWKTLDIDIPGRVLYKYKIDGRILIEMIGVKKEDHKKVHEMIWGF